MKIRLSFKTPDVIDEAIKDIEDEDIQFEAKSVCEKFVQWGEALVIEVDTETKEAKVIPV